MNIELKKFGLTLTSRQSGKEAFSAFSSRLAELGESEKIVVDFSGVNTFSPSWGDEFLTPLNKKYGERLVLKKTDNLSVKATISILEESNGSKYNIEK